MFRSLIGPLSLRLKADVFEIICRMLAEIHQKFASVAAESDCLSCPLNH